MEQGEADPHRDGDQKAQMGLDMPHTTKACIQHHKASPGLESPEKAQVGSPEAVLTAKREGELLRPYVPQGIKRNKSSKVSHAQV